jgi:hypothetical protein
MIGAVAAGSKKRAGAGAGAGTDPIGVAGLTLALIEGQGVTVNTTPDPDQVSAWASQAPATLDWVQATSGNQPEYVSGAVKCQANDRQMSADGGWLLSDLIDVDGYTAYVLFTLNTDAPAVAELRQGAAIIGDPAYATYFPLAVRRDTGVDYAYAEHYDGTRLFTPDTAISQGVLYLARSRYDSAAGFTYCRVNGAETSVAAGDQIIPGDAYCHLFNGFGGNQPPVTLYRAYVFNAHLSSNDRDGIDTWFQAQYPTVTL